MVKTLYHVQLLIHQKEANPHIIPLSFPLNLHTRNIKMATKIATATEISDITRVDSFLLPPIANKRAKKRYLSTKLCKKKKKR